jgi:RND family efflux transporter MFP subunit
LTVVAEVKGKIVEKRVNEGARVQKGDVIARIDARDYENAFASAKASYEVAQLNQSRLQTLFKNSAATQAQIDDISAAAATSKAAMDSAALALERCTIIAPLSGVIDRLPIETGQFMDAGKPVADLLDIERVKVVVGIPESDVDSVRRLQRFAITVDALGGKTFEGTRHHLTKTSDNFARLYNLEIEVQNPAHEILPDMFTRVSIIKNEVADGLAVPLYALIKRNELDAVFVVTNGTAQLKPVQLGFQDGWRTQVRDGLAAGDQVVVVGQRSIDDGEPIQVTRTVRALEELIQ